MPFTEVLAKLEQCNVIYRKTDTHQIFAEYPTEDLFHAYLKTRFFQLNSVEILLQRYRGIEYYRNWLIERTVKQISSEAIENTTEGITKALGKHPKPAVEGDQLYAGTTNRLIQEIQSEAAKEVVRKRNAALLEVQDYVTTNINAVFSGVLDMDELMKNFDDDITERLGSFAGNYRWGTLKDKVKAAYDDTVTELSEAIDEDITNLRDDHMASVEFWGNMESEYEENEQDNSAPAKIGGKILAATEDVILYAKEQIITETLVRRKCPYLGEMVAITGVDVDNEKIEIVANELSVDEADVEEKIADTVLLFIKTCTSGKIGSIIGLLDAPTFVKFNQKAEASKMVKGKDAYNMAWELWTKRHKGALQTPINKCTKPPKIKEQDTEQEEYQKWLDKEEIVFAKAVELGIHDKYLPEAILGWYQYHKIIQIPVNEGGLKKAVETILFRDRVNDYKNAGAGVTVGKVAPIFAMISDIVNRSKNDAGTLDAALKAEPTSKSSSEILGGFAQVFTLENVLTTIAKNVIPGFSFVAAIAVIPSLAEEAKTAWGARKMAKDQYDKVSTDLTELNKQMESDVHIHARNIEKKAELEAKKFTLGVVITKKLRQFIWDIVEILKRVMGICATILKILGITALAGFSIGAIKSAIHAIQQTYFIGRAVYKAFKGTKGADRRAAANRIADDAFGTPPEDYALDLIVKLKAHHGISESITTAKSLTTKVNGVTAGGDIRTAILNMRSDSSDIEHIPNREAEMKAEIKSTLFKKLSSKPTASISRLLFPGMGGVSNVAKAI